VRWEETSEYPKGRLTAEVSIAPVFDDAGSCSHLVGAMHDITERRKLEAQFRQAQKMESVGQLAGGIAHDFNNLLTVINATADFGLAQLREGDQLHEDLREIRRAGERAAALTRQLLAFSRKQILQPEVMNLNTIVVGMESLLRRLIGEDIDLVVVPTQSLGNVKADSGQIEQVIANLAVNARDAMPQGGKLTIEMRNVEIDEQYEALRGVAMQPGPYVMLAISDTGIGMDEVTRAKLFEPFFTTKGPGKGTGLGLSTVYGIVKQSDGFIWVYSEIGRGTSFKIYLPRVAEVAGSKQRSPTVASAHGTETILVVEDVRGLRLIAKRMLESAGYTVLTAASGEEALLLLKRHEQQVHLVVTDVVMPGMSGLTLAKRSNGTRPGMKVLYISGYTDDVVVRHGMLDEGMPFLGKPFTAIDLTRKVREVLDSQSRSAQGSRVK
jgi:signal transduction histidine kinase/CheY-like chemotaxis protein